MPGPTPVQKPNLQLTGYVQIVRELKQSPASSGLPFTPYHKKRLLWLVGQPLPSRPVRRYFPRPRPLEHGLDLRHLPIASYNH